MSPRLDTPQPPYAAIFKQNERDRDKLAVAEADAEIPAILFSVTNPRVCPDGFKDWILERKWKQWGWVVMAVCLLKVATLMVAAVGAVEASEPWRLMLFWVAAAPSLTETPLSWATHLFLPQLIHHVSKPDPKALITSLWLLLSLLVNERVCFRACFLCKYAAILCLPVFTVQSSTPAPIPCADENNPFTSRFWSASSSFSPSEIDCLQSKSILSLTSSLQ
ncbi:hypothetical protein XENOCAPTIV_009004 [Xenoophorus captivus]|uniref:Uncharacterized protein n=1 Tax=Xenoophorus captivus TaxID=1517983 RepID=A0ABV0RKQ0_9TELE